jgi:hypothetical protein
LSRGQVPSRIYGFEKSGGTQALVMELVTGRLT